MQNFQVGLEVEIINVYGMQCQKGIIVSWKISSVDHCSVTVQFGDRPNTMTFDSQNVRLINTKNNTMSNGMFKGTTAKALAYYHFGSKCELTEVGLKAFTTYVFETGDVAKEGFFKKVVESYKEDTNKK